MPSTRLPSSAERHRSGPETRVWWIAAALALISGLLMLCYPLMPVDERTARYHWASVEQPRASLVLNPWRPVQLTVTGTCGGDGSLSTLETNGEQNSVSDPMNASGLAGTGMVLRQQGNHLDLTSGEYRRSVSLGACQNFTINMTAGGYSIDAVAGQSRRVAEESVNILPVVNGFFEGPGEDGTGAGPWNADLVADTRYSTSPSMIKAVLAVAAAVLLAAAMAMVALLGRRPRTAGAGIEGSATDESAGGGAGAARPSSVAGAVSVRETLTETGTVRTVPDPEAAQAPKDSNSTRKDSDPVPRRRAVPRWLDAAMPALLLLGMLIGGTTDDDGFIAQILRTPSMDGYIGNYVRWNNAPEAPFGWFYEVYAWWGQFSHEPVWLRIPPLLLGVVGWLVLRALLGRLLPIHRAGVGWTDITVAGSYLSFWLVFCNSLRPEIIYALGTAVVTLLVYDALVRRTPWRLVVAAVVAGLAIGAGPTGLVALGPFIIAGKPLWRWARCTSRAAVAAVGLAWLAGLGAVVLLMFDDQTLATVAHATKVRTDFGPVYPIWQDYLRYWRLFQSFAGRQVLVYLAVVALLFLGWRLIGSLRERSGSQNWAGLNRDLLILITGTAFVLVPAMLLSPTKLPHHFGALALLGPLAIGACVQLLRQVRPHPIAWPLLIGGGATMAALSLHQNNRWWKLSTLGLVADRNVLAFAGVPLFLPAMAVTIIATGGALWWLRRRSGPPSAAVSKSPWTLVSKVLAVVLALSGVFQLANFGYGALSRRGHYTIASANLAAIQGRGCLLERTLMVEPDPVAGRLTENGQPGWDFLTRETTGSGLPVWTPTAEEPNLQSAWLEIPEAARTGEFPLVVSAAGLDERHRLIVEFDTGESRNIKQSKKNLGSSVLADSRIQVAKDAPRATRVRLRTESQGEPWATVDDVRGARSQPLTVGVPRVPRDVIPLSEVMRGYDVAFAWNLAFFAPCAAQPRLAQGRAERADFVVSDSQVPGNISYQAKNGGPFAGVLAQSQQYRIPIYAPGDYTESTMNNLDLVGLGKLISDEVGPPQTGTVRRSGWADQPG